MTALRVPMHCAMCCMEWQCCLRHLDSRTHHCKLPKGQCRYTEDEWQGIIDSLYLTTGQRVY